jgi:MerR family mercuric resistance operon transcriptional regulator
MQDHLTIGRIARGAGTGVETIRFYERQGLIAKPGRTSSGYRMYPPDAMRRLRFIRHAKELGFSLREIKELLSLRVTAGKSCGDVRQRARQKITEIDHRIAALARMKQALVKLSAACSGKGPVAACPILDALEMQEIAE